jgi:HAD superfamily hydrolase (TIGR01549 family)
MTISAILWDYDGTLVDSSNKNFMTTRDIILHLNPTMQENELPLALTSLEKYRAAIGSSINWRDFYMNHFGMSEQQVDDAGALWSEFQLKNQTPVEIFDGIHELLNRLSPIPQGICSLNCMHNIEKKLQQCQLLDYFSSIVGYNSNLINKPKPNPESFMICLQQMKVPVAGNIICIGDHPEDTEFARNAETLLRNDKNQLRIINIAVCYSGSTPDHWEIKPDYQAQTVSEIMSIIASYST